MDELTREERIEQYMEEHRKSVAGALVLTFFFGPLGFLYVSIPWGVVLILASLGLAIISPMVPGVIWLVCIIASPFGVADHNKMVWLRAEAQV